MRGKIYDIEALRCFSIIAVILQHIDHLFPYPIPIIGKIHHYLGGGFGVDLFLTVSGFLVAQSLITKLENHNTFTQKKHVIINFWVKRMWRLWPAAWACLAVILVCVVFLNESLVFGTLSANIDATIAGFFHFANYRFYSTFLQSEYGVSFVYWSLSLEEQFYFIFPILLILLPKNKAIYFIAACIVLQLIVARSQNLLFIFFRTDAIMLGAIIAYIHQKKLHVSFKEKIKNHKSTNYKIALTLALLLMSLLTGSELLSQYKYSWLAIISFCLVFIASLNLDKFTAKSSIRNITLWFGKHSYSIYLTHIPVYYVTREIVFKLNQRDITSITNSWLYLAIATLLIPLAAHCSYKYIENPFRIYGKKLTDKKLESIPT